MSTPPLSDTIQPVIVTMTLPSDLAKRAFALFQEHEDLLSYVNYTMSFTTPDHATLSIGGWDPLDVAAVMLAATADEERAAQFKLFWWGAQ